MEMDLNVSVSKDGSGSVEVVVGLDADAVDKIGGDLGSVLAVDDLEQAGWSIDGPAKDPDGFTRVHITHRFGNPDEAAAVFEQIAGKDGPFQDFAVDRDVSLARTKWRFSGRIDFSGGLEAFGDEALAGQLDGEPLGQSVKEIEDQLGDSLSRLVQVRVRARLPGDVSSNAVTKADNGAVWQVGFGESDIPLEAEGTQWRTTTLVAGGIGALALLALVVLLLLRLAHRATSRGGEPTAEQVEPRP
jgi:hypothetical protein